MPPTDMLDVTEDIINALPSHTHCVTGNVVNILPSHTTDAAEKVVNEPQYHTGEALDATGDIVNDQPSYTIIGPDKLKQAHTTKERCNSRKRYTTKTYL